MKAIVFKEYGSSKVLELVERPMPKPAKEEVVVRVMAAGVNPADWRLRNGQFKRAFKLELPFTPGSDLSGVVVEVGASVTAFRNGDRVFAMSALKKAGAYAEFVAVNEAHVAPLPDSLTFVEGAAIPLAGLTALQGLRDQGAIEPGQAVLINGGSGGVGSFAVQIANAIGAKVTAICSGPNIPFVKSLGADEVLDYTTINVFAGPGRYDVIFDTMALVGFRSWRKPLKNDGTLVTVNPIIGKLLPRFVTRLFGINRLRSFFVEPSGLDLNVLADYAIEKTVLPRVERTFRLEEAGLAQDLSENGRVRGKLVLTLDQSLSC